LFAPSHSEKILGKVFDAGADVVLLDLEDAVPPSEKDRARHLATVAAHAKPCWVRVNRPRTETCAMDIEALRLSVRGFRLPKVESAADVEWAASRAPGTPLDCTIESAKGLAAAMEIAMHPACALLSFGSIDFARDLGIGLGETELLHARSALVVAARAADKPPPSDGVHALIRDDEGLRREAEHAKRLGFFGKSAIHPEQIPIINEVFTPTDREVAWARAVVAAFEAAGGAATSLPDGEFVDLPVAERARDLLARLADAQSPDSGVRA
jgi:citrate lyase subunit beta/citryl-CoA lyase